MGKVSELLRIKEESRTTDSISKRDELRRKISMACYSLLNEIAEYETDIDPDDRLVLDYHYDRGLPEAEEYTFYEYDNSLRDNCICILHNYCFRGMPNTDEFLIPNYVVEDVNAGLHKYYAKKHIHGQNAIRESILHDLRKIKKRLQELKNIPDDCQKIIENDFWDLI